MTPFDFINSINNKTKIEWDDAVEKAYTPFIINRGLSFNLQTVLFANMMNKYPTIDKKMQYDFYFYGVSKGRRYDKWIKKEGTAADIQAIREFYHINNFRALEVLKILSNEQLEIIKVKLSKGGSK